MLEKKKQCHGLRRCWCPASTLVVVVVDDLGAPFSPGVFGEPLFVIVLKRFPTFKPIGKGEIIEIHHVQR